MALHSDRSWSDYARRLQENQPEVEALYHDLLINVTSFFRNPELFDALQAKVYPELIKGRSPTAPLRLWVPGCSTGQEAYSLAISLLEFFGERAPRPPIQIFATDLADQTALDKARAGVYPESIEGEVSPERLRRYFQREDHIYRINKTIRDMCVFARQNVTTDPPFSHVDLISCRNVLIYLSTPLQKRVLPTFHYALNVPGFLVLGTAETVGENADLFELVDRGYKIYSKKVTPARVSTFLGFERSAEVEIYAARRYGAATPTPADFQREADRLVLRRYAPPGVLVDENHDVVQFRGRTSAFLEVPSGEPTTNVLKMAREGLFLELRGALADARRSNEPVFRRGVRVRSEDGIREVALEVIPVRPPGGGEGCLLILFDDGSIRPAAGDRVAALTPPESVGTVDGGVRGSGSDGEGELARLRQELAATKEYLQSLVEQQDAANEELRSANEEILSSNEELQSTNEELETAKEELQSVNEELTTVNEQLQNSNVGLTRLTDDLTNLMTSTQIPVVMVGGDLRIRRFTAAAAQMMSLLPGDVGRLIRDLNPLIQVADLDALIAEVIDRTRPEEREVRDREGRWYRLRVSPYRTGDGKIEGAVLVLMDIDQIRRTQEDLSRHVALLDLSLDAIVVRDGENVVTYWNRGAQVMYGWSARHASGGLGRAQRAARALINVGSECRKPWFRIRGCIPRPSMRSRDSPTRSGSRSPRLTAGRSRSP